jgi:SAM-dependent methyltransferase
VRPGFRRDQLRARYDVQHISEDLWHAYSGERTSQIVREYLRGDPHASCWLLNAGAGIYRLASSDWQEVPLDLFAAPLVGRPWAVCSSVERLPFAGQCFGSVVCVGEVLAYCDPATAFVEFARVLAPGGLLICDFGSTRSFRQWFKKPYGRAADLVVDHYNGAPENTWIYDPSYIHSLLERSGFVVRSRVGTHAWSALARRLGLSATIAMHAQRRLESFKVLEGFSDLMTYVACRCEAST